MHPTLVVQHRSRTNANHDIMRFVVRALEEMNVICGDQRKTQFFRQHFELRVDELLRFETVIVHF